MELIQHTPELSAQIAPGEAIDHEHSPVRGIAARLTVDHPDAYSCEKASFELVRDAIAHSVDADRGQSAFAVRSESNVLDYPVQYSEPVVSNVPQAAPDRAHLWQTLPTEL
ncbi:hypothetical protein [Streptomyces sp. NPDC051310]|uniref:hypothetical protein n=1 Tax=Streptomyces sp. NPDC051310 TaxID=3365649 RepID=UPI00379350A2